MKATRKIGYPKNFFTTIRLSFLELNKYIISEKILPLFFKWMLLSFYILIMSSCEANEEDTHPEDISNFMLIENPEKVIKVNLFYVESETSIHQSDYHLDEAEFFEYLNGYYFHKYGIGLELAQSQSLVNDELYDLRDNRGGEPSTFFMQCADSYEKDKLNIYIIKRSNIIGIAGMGRSQRVLLTYENLFTSTSPHEIGHALGLFHDDETVNIMSTTLDKQSRKHFNHVQEEKMKKRIDMINTNNAL
ncbi:matrixin family metalloprotease [Aquimarina spongiae]|uniref:Matrixin n=1 Tax=Aquimarina spongiae TaxID=570521 RepID=A0A1M6EC92_9FLAO|nr:matrixin family metalloprotease [Aquimarina spongiae]SHI83061.1 Matrixin [Aquimarina spongiae]